MAKQTFTAGQVLTAAQVNGLQTNDFNLTVSTKTAAYTFVVGDRGTRVVLNDSTARTFTIDDAIFSAGDTIQVHNINTGVLTIAAGAGVTLNGADVLTLAQYQSGTIFFTSASSAIFFPTAKTVSAGGLVFITGDTFTTATSVSLPNSTFTSTHRNYRLLLNVTAFTSDVDLTMRMRASGSDNTTSNYRTVGIGLNSSAVAANITANATSSFNMSEADINTGDYTLTLDILSPQTTDDTNLVGQVTTYQKSPNGLYSINYGLSFLANTQFDSLSFISSVASSISGVYRVYGYADS